MSTGVRVTIAEYDRMIANGEFEPAEEHHVELIRGEIRQMSPIHPPHEDALDRLLRWSFENVSTDEVRVRVQCSLGIPEFESVPQPDLIWVRQQDYSKSRPTVVDLLLVAEVADSSLRFDRGEKSELYAEAGVQEYWIVNVKAREIEVRRKPAGRRFEDVRIAKLGESVSPLEFPELTLQVGDLFPEK